MKQVRRRVYTLKEAIYMDMSVASGEDEFIGYNAYPCNSGLISHSERE